MGELFDNSDLVEDLMPSLGKVSFFCLLFLSYFMRFLCSLLNVDFIRLLSLATIFIYSIFISSLASQSKEKLVRVVKRKDRKKRGMNKHLPNLFSSVLKHVPSS